MTASENSFLQRFTGVKTNHPCSLRSKRLSNIGRARGVGERGRREEYTRSSDCSRPNCTQVTAMLATILEVDKIDKIENN